MFETIFPIYLPNFSPTAFAIGLEGFKLEIRWYSLAYIFGILSTLFYLKYSNKKENFMSQKAYDDWLTWAVLSIILGGRLGYVFFYNAPYFLENPLEIFAVWQGGMSFHGGLLGAILGMYLFARHHKINFLHLTDILVVIAPIGLFFGRIANFINLELYGRITNSNYGIVFPGAGPFPRHPSQLYEAFLEGILLFIILISLKKFTKISQIKGRLSGVFLIFYGCFRMFVEIFRQPDEQIGFLFNYLTLGQILSLPLVLFGIYLVFFQRPMKKNLAKN
jgi:phosphatidylglycerol:prolipoprotein diacylglycerol transferase